MVHGVYGDRWWVYLGFLQTYDFDWVFGGIGAAWSLCVEVSFYVLLPVYAFLLGRLGARLGKHGRVRLDLAILAALGLASLITRGVVQSHPADELSFSVLPQTIVCHFLWFALGMGLAVVSAAAQHGGAGPWMHRATHALRAHPNVLWASALLVLLAVSLYPRLPATGGPRDAAGIMGVHVAYGLFGLLVFIPAVMAETRGNVPRRILSNRVLSWLGLVSYGIFLWHQPLSGELARHGAAEWLPGSALVSVTAATFAVAVACAAASYYLLERPVLRLKHTRRERPPRTAPAESTVAP
jgi:peptidoglycan/LPS O-acetylase OafA/YrhL